MKKMLLILVSLLVLAALACNINTPGTPTPNDGNVNPVPTGNEQNNTTGGQGDCPDCPDCSACPTPEPTAFPSMPVMINEGLSSLDSYIFAVHMISSGPTALDMTEYANETRRANEPSATYTRIYNTSSSAEEPEPSSSTTEMYSIGMESCTVSEGTDFSYSTSTAAEDEMSGMLTSLVDFQFLSSDPTLVGEETMNGIASRHFRFSVPNLGVESGMEVITNQGDYWIAVDGNYLVKYVLVIEMRSSPEEVSRLEFTSELTQVNQAISIAFPQGCLDAQAATP